MRSEAHLRIDEGVKRGPRQYRLHQPKRRDTARTTIPEDLDPNEVLERYLTDQTTSQIATSYGVSRKTLVRWLIAKAPLQWRQVQLVRAHARKLDADEGIEGASDALSLARAREMLRSGQFDLQALDPDYQPKQQVMMEVNHHVTVELALSEQAGKLLDRIRQPGNENAAVLMPVLVGDTIDGQVQVIDK